MFSNPIYSNIQYSQPQYQNNNNSHKLPSFSELVTSISLPNEFPLNQPASSSPVYPVYYYPQQQPQAPPSQPMSPKESLSTSSTITKNHNHNHNMNQLNTKRKHICKVCFRNFTTSGHLARHNRIHTGERKHVCPFPDCGARFARQDNCNAHQKTHNNSIIRKRRSKKLI